MKLPLIPAPAGVESFELSGERLLDLEMEAEREGSLESQGLDLLLLTERS